MTLKNDEAVTEIKSMKEPEEVVEIKTESDNSVSVLPPVVDSTNTSENSVEDEKKLGDKPIIVKEESKEVVTTASPSTDPSVPVRKLKNKKSAPSISTRPALRPRKSDAAATPNTTLPPKRAKKPPPETLETVPPPSDAEISTDGMLPPDLPMVESIPDVKDENPTVEMPQLISETSSSASSEGRSESQPQSTSRPPSSKPKRRYRLTHPKGIRRKLDNRKERKVPSPSLAEGNVNAAGPESSATATEALAMPLCLCGRKPQVFVSSNNNPGDLTCQALDSLEGRVVGCCNPLPSTTVGLHRPSSRSPYIMLCAVHLQRLLRHNCCPGCGLYCTQGKYLMCSQMHHYHKHCLGQEGCPHCGDPTPPKPITMTLKSRRDPVFLLRPRAIRASKPAKISTGNRLPALKPVEPQPIPLPPEVEHFMASGGIDALPEAASDSLETEKLAELLDVACSLLTSAFISNPNRYQLLLLVVLDSSLGCYVCAHDISQDKHRKTSFKPLLAAVKTGEPLKLLKVMASGLTPNHVFADHQNQTALHIAASLGHNNLIRILLLCKVPIDLLDANHNSALALAVLGGHHDVVSNLVKSGASLILKCEYGMTPLHLAAKNGDVQSLSILLRAPCLPRRYVDILDDGGWTPLVWASEYNHVDVVRLLIKEGGDPLIRDSEQNIALHWAAYGGCVDVVEHLLALGCDISAINVQGDTPLHIAARQDKHECVLLLMARGARTDLKNGAGHLPVDCALEESPIKKELSLHMELSSLLSRFKDRGPKVLSNDISRGRERNPVQCVNAVDDEPEPRDYLYVSENCFTSRITVDRSINSMQSCSCSDNCTSGSCACTSISLRAWYDSEGKLSPEFDYNETPMIFECNQGCGCNQITCQNRVVQNGVQGRFQLFRTQERGWGIKTLAYIPKGTFVCEYVGEIISDSEADQREDDSYLFDLENRDGEIYCVDARRYGNFARFINHLCQPNLIQVQVFIEQQDLRFPRMAFFANRDIQPNEELGYDYGIKFWMIKYKQFTCVCKSENCSFSETTIHETLKKYHKRQQEIEECEQAMKL